MRAAKTLTRLRLGAGSSEPSLLVDAISTKMTCTGLFNFYYKQYMIRLSVIMKMVISTVLPTKSGSESIFCLQNYHRLIIDISRVYKSYPQERFNTLDISSSEMYTLVFYLAIVNKVLRHCQSWLARQYLLTVFLFPRFRFEVLSSNERCLLPTDAML